jgi:DeoR family transcriptional regulator, fructose operon transcriptional repressor
MYAEERQEEILRLARGQGRVDVTALADGFQVTAETIRRDLTVLERAGVLRRVHGGAIPVERIGFEPALAARDSVLITEKERIAKAALAELPDEGAVILDAGSTTARLAQALPTDRELSVVVNSPVLATVLGTRANLTVLLLGGRVRGKTLATVDDWALRPLADMYVDVAVKRAMIAAARRVVLLADHTKIGNDYLARFGTVGDLDVLITDTGLDAELAGDVEAAGVRVVRA